MQKFIKTASYSVAVAMFAASVPLAASAHDIGHSHQHRSNHNNQVVGGLVGAVVGGVIGSQVSGNGARTEGSAIGAVVGGLAGASIAGRSNSHYQHRPSSYGQGYGSYSHGYSQPRYPTTNHRPVYNHGHPTTSYYGSTYRRPAVSISIGTGTQYGGHRGHYTPPRRRHNGHSGYRRAGHHQRNRGHHRRGHHGQRRGY